MKRHRSSVKKINTFTKTDRLHKYLKKIVQVIMAMKHYTSRRLYVKQLAEKQKRIRQVFKNFKHEITDNRSKPPPVVSKTTE